MGICFWCLGDKEVVLFGRLQGDVRAPHQVIVDREPCDACKKYAEAGVILISVRDAPGDDPKNPYRTGGWVVLKDAAIRRLIRSEELLAHVLKTRLAFVPDAIWDALELPRPKVLT